MARQAKSLFPIKWEENLDRPLNELRSELNIQPVTTGLWSWYTRPLLQEAISASQALGSALMFRQENFDGSKTRKI
ncbi:hypothetical protein BST81_09380 [Leptolyngbya sp. 'hensonii']|nr:hypothetical protein BST81_09380 [Leptolyngbya sp. 'hensonii']